MHQIGRSASTGRLVVVVTLSLPVVHPKDRDIRQRTLRVVAYTLDLRHCPNEIA